MRFTFTESETTLLGVLWHLRQTSWMLVETEKLVRVFTTYQDRVKDFIYASPTEQTHDKIKAALEGDLVKLIARNLVMRNGKNLLLVAPTGVRAASDRALPAAKKALAEVVTEIFPVRTST